MHWRCVDRRRVRRAVAVDRQVGSVRWPVVGFLIVLNLFWTLFSCFTFALAAVVGGLGTLIWLLGPRDTTQASTQDQGGTDLFRPGL